MVPSEPVPGQVPTVLQRMVASGIPETRVHSYLQRGWVRVDGVVVHGPDHPAPAPAAIAIYSI